jgi:homoserine O-acetyltransferase
VFHYPYPFPLEAGGQLPGFQLAFTTWGTLNPARDNVVWVLHALTGHPDVTHWWGNLFGPGKTYDPARHFIVCANALGGCYGSTGALSTNPQTSQPYYHAFPALTNRDIVRGFIALATKLGIRGIHTLIGGSLGGQQALEWAIQQPGFIRNLVVMATNAVHSPWAIAFNESQRAAIQADTTWRKNRPYAGASGLRVARGIAMLSYRSYDCYNQTQPLTDAAQLDNYAASTYQQHQGNKLARRFNAFTYWAFSKAMDSHNVGRHRGGVRAALGTITARTLVVGIPTDILFPLAEQELLADAIPSADLKVVESLYGHDGFLTETENISQCLQTFYQLQPA